jgi:uncharacterized membrane protein YccF (DUF307 family)
MNSILAAVARPNDHRLLMLGGAALIVLGLWLADDGLRWQTAAVATAITLAGIGLAAGMLRVLILRTACGPRRP